MGEVIRIQLVTFREYQSINISMVNPQCIFGGLKILNDQELNPEGLQIEYFRWINYNRQLNQLSDE